MYIIYSYIMLHISARAYLYLYICMLGTLKIFFSDILTCQMQLSTAFAHCSCGTRRPIRVPSRVSCTVGSSAK